MTLLFVCVCSFVDLCWVCIGIRSMNLMVHFVLFEKWQNANECHFIFYFIKMNRMVGVSNVCLIWYVHAHVFHLLARDSVSEWEKGRKEESKKEWKELRVKLWSFIHLNRVQSLNRTFIYSVRYYIYKDRLARADPLLLYM